MAGVPGLLQHQIRERENRLFLRRLYRLEPGASKRQREKVLNSGNKQKRMLVIQLLHQIWKGEIPLRKEHESAINQSGKIKFFMDNFQNAEDVKKLLKASNREQKQVLADVNNYHILFAPLMKHR